MTFQRDIQGRIHDAALPTDERDPELSGLALVGSDLSSWQGQNVYLDFDGAEDVVYSGPVTVGPFDIPAFSARQPPMGQKDSRQDVLLRPVE